MDTGQTPVITTTTTTLYHKLQKEKQEAMEKINTSPLIPEPDQPSPCLQSSVLSLGDPCQTPLH